MDVKIFGSRLSPFVEKVIRGVQRKGLAWELIEPKSPADLERWNPQTGKMPVVELDGERLFDSTFILRRLDELVPSPPLVSDDPVVAAHQRQIEDWADEALYWYGMAFHWTPKNAAGTAGRMLGRMRVPGFLRPVVAPILRRRIGGQLHAQGLGRLPEATLAREFGEKLDDLLRMLGDRPFFHSDAPSVADLAVYGQLRVADDELAPETRDAIRARPRLVEYMKRVEQATGG
jgi:glutathione S-transferase